MYMHSVIVPDVSTATPRGRDRAAEVAASPSPLNPKTPLPAMVVIIPTVGDSVVAPEKDGYDDGCDDGTLDSK